MRRRALLAAGLASTTAALAGCGGFLGSSGPTRSAGGFFVLRTATHNDFAGDYLIDGIEHDGGVVESFEGGLADVEEVQLDDTQSYEVVDRAAVDGDSCLYYGFGPQETRDASNSRGHLRRPMAVEGTERLAVWANQLEVPQDDVRVGWGYEGAKPHALAFNLHRETTAHVHVQTNAGTDVDLGFVAPDAWLKYEFADLDWTAGTATARVETEDGEERVSEPVEFVPPADDAGN